jgi:small subunit ribosomal protein S6
MRDYESTFILAPTLDAEGVQKEIEAVKGFISKEGGEVTAEKEWGRRRLAYPIQDHSEGVYHILRFNLEGEKLGELNRFFRLNENVLRALVIRDEGTPLDYVGQSSESEEDSRDRRHGPGRPRDRDSRFGGSDDRRERRPAPARSGSPEPEAAPAGAAKEEASPDASASAAGGEEKKS